MSIVDLSARKAHCASWYTRTINDCSIQHDTDEGLADNAIKGYSAIVIAIAAIAFVFVERDDVGITHVLGHTFFLPALKE